MGWVSKQAIVATILSGALAVAGCTTATPEVEPTPTAKHRTKVVRTTTAPKIVKQKKVTAKKLIKPIQNETAPVIAPLGGSGGSGGGGSAGGNGGWSG
ncbi:hypothetical protein RFM68_04340 [Mesorhizobium sp. MSK_1335]|uniref:Lipoprotein n=1 Tax=Mesorhizobium montanum TaxID=3072323 RepID=A0ABU4ZEF7_9HYPH|nr:hypothetical protein [Mesorhizobium sp. MSK_1335]MDX8523729.1 hypothetical protein [Mesorhizobium sp. MSK_1335]